jgi:hypothetical protein
MTMRSCFALSEGRPKRAREALKNTKEGDSHSFLGAALAFLGAALAFLGDSHSFQGAALVFRHVFLPFLRNEISLPCSEIQEIKLALSERKEPIYLNILFT